MRVDRKRLKCDRLDLLSQTRDLYKTLEIKENEIRDFLKYYEKKTSETSIAVKKLINSKAEMEKEIGELRCKLENMNDEKNQDKLIIESKNITIKKLQKELFDVRKYFRIYLLS
jgi:hypothetical protein